MENVIANYDAVLQSIQTYDANPENKFSLLTREVYVYSLKIYQAELFKSLQRTPNSISILQPKQIYNTLFNIALLSINYLGKYISNTSNTTNTTNTTNTSNKSNKSKSQIMDENRTLFHKKNADYGNSFQDFELIGILVRLNDKINRIVSLDNTSPYIHDEKMEDTMNDLYNYSIIGLMYNRSPHV